MGTREKEGKWTEEGEKEDYIYNDLFLKLNGLPWKQAEIILSLLRLHPNTAFRNLLLTMRATPLLLRDIK